MSGKVSISFEVNSFNDVIMFMDALDSSPKIPLFVLIFMAKLESLSFDGNSFLNGESCTNPVNKLDFCCYAGCPH